MPVFNGEKYLREAVDSILGQSYKDFEFVIIDDGSTDRTPAIVREYADHDARVRVLSGPNLGYTRALVKGVAVSSGELVARMDADDIALPERLERQVNFLTLRPDCVAVGAVVLVIDSDGDPVLHRRYPSQHEDIEAQHFTGQGCALAHPATMFRRAAYEKAGGYRPEFEPAEDLDLWLRMAEVGKLGNVGEELLKYRVHLRGTSLTRQKEQHDKTVLALEAACRRRHLALPPQALFNQASGDCTGDGMLRQARGFACLAWESGFYHTARKHARIQLAAAPRSLVSWKYFVRCYLGPLSRPLVCGALLLRRQRNRESA